MEPWQNDPIALQQISGEPWQNDPIVQSQKAPDMSGVQKMAQQNLSVPKPEDSENKEAQVETQSQRLDTAIGMPVSKLLNSNDNSPVAAPIRKQYIRALQNGDAADFGDFAQSMFHSILPIAAGVIRNTEAQGRIAKAALEGVGEGYESGALFPIPIESNVQTILGTAGNIPIQALSSAFGGFQAASVQAGKEVGNPSLGRDIALFPESMMGGEGMSPHPPVRGVWDSVAGKDILAEHVGKIADKPVAEVTSPDFDHVIAQQTKSKAPSGNDFKAVDTVTNGILPEKNLHVVFDETGIKPDQVFADAKHDPEIAREVSEGKVPEAYEHLVEPKQFTPEQGDGLKVVQSDTGKNFNVIDADGDRVHGGFDSVEEARHYIEDERFKAEERAAIEAESKAKPVTTEKTSAGEQQVIPGAEKISDKSLAERIMGKLLGSDKEQKPANEGLFDTDLRKQQDIFEHEAKTNIATEVVKPNIIPPSSIGKPTSLRSFLSNNGAKFNEANELISIKKDGKIIKGAGALDYAHEISQEHGYLPKNEANKPAQSINDLKNTLTEKNGGREAWRDVDADRVVKAEEAKRAKQNLDPSKIEHEANSVGIDTERLKDESEKQYISRLTKTLQDFYKSEEGAVAPDFIRKAIGDVINTAEKWTGKLTGGFFEKLGDAYTKTFQPELIGPLAKRADAFMAKFKASLQEAQNSFYRQSAADIKRWDRKSSDERMEWLNDHDTGRWNKEENPDHARFQALFDATYKAEKEAIGADADKGYKENYLPHAWEKPDEVKAYFNSDAYIKKFGKDGFTKRSEFQLVQDGVRAGFKLKTDNPERMLMARLLAGDNMIRTMDLLKDMESSGIATRATTFGIDKKIAKTETAIADLEKKYKEAFEKANKPEQVRAEGVPPSTSKTMELVQKRLNDLYTRLENFNKEKDANKLSPEQMKELKGGFKIIGPDSKVWNIHQQAGPLWKNAMDSKGLWENQGIIGDGFRAYMQGKAIWVSNKLALSLFHPSHMMGIHLSSGGATALDHVIQGGDLKDLDFSKTSLRFGFGGKDTGVNPFTRNKDATLGFGRDHPAVVAWNTTAEMRTPEQQKIVTTMTEGGFKPTMSAQESVHFKENWDKAVNGLGVQNLRLFGSAAQAMGSLSAPVFQSWIPALKSDSYLYRADLAMKRDPSLATDAGKRSEVLRQIAKDVDRNYGEMNQDTLFWNKTVRDAFNASMLSGGWKLAMIQNFRGLAEPAKVAYDFAKTGEFSKEQITHQMLQSYIYTGVMLAQGAILTKLLTGAVGGAISWAFPDTGDKNPDGSEIRLQQPAFLKEGFMFNRDVNEEGLLSGTGKFLYHQTLIPGIADTLNNHDFIGRKLISDPTDLHQWASAGWDSINPITLSAMDKADQKGSKTAKVMGVLGFPTAGAYINQTAFEQKVIHTYDEQNPPKGDAYSAKLKGELKSAMTNGDEDKIESTKQRMKKEGMTDSQISSASKVYTKPFVEAAWSKLSSQDQKRLIESATDKEKEKFKVK